MAALVLLAGCSGKSSSSSSNTTTPPATTAGGSTTVPSFVGSSSSAYCNLARQFSQTLNPTSGDPKSLFAQFDTVSDRFQSTAPSAIKADADVVIGALKKLEMSFKNANYDVTKIMPADLAPIQDPKFTASTARIDAYDTQVCGLTTPTS